MSVKSYIVRVLLIVLSLSVWFTVAWAEAPTYEEPSIGKMKGVIGPKLGVKMYLLSGENVFTDHFQEISMLNNSLWVHPVWFHLAMCPMIFLRFAWHLDYPWSQETQIMAQEPDFRQVVWGVTPEQVMQSENRPIQIEGEMQLGYMTQFLDVDVGLTYRFIPCEGERRLAAAIYSTFHQYPEQNIHIDEYYQFKKVLQDQYGDGQAEVIWQDELFKNQPQHFGIAIAVDHLQMISRWETPRTIIELRLQGFNSNVQMTVKYWSKKYLPQLRQY